MKKRVLPPTYLLVALAALVAVHFLWPVTYLVFFPWNLLGIAPLAAGVAITLIADRAFKKAGTTVKPFEESASLVTTGVFRICRHPMYLGMTLILLGVAVLLGSLTPLIPVIVFPVLMELVFIRVEERMLEETFGEAWAAYKRKVRRWV